MSKSTDPCRGCRNDFYNGQNELGVKACWSLKKAKLVTRFKQPWWEAYPFRSTKKVKTYDCHHEPGQYGFSKTDPRPAKGAK